MAWFSDWDKRSKIILDKDQITSALANYPIMVKLSISCGQTNQDMTRVFDEIGANKLKMAITKSDGTTQCYCEVEYWDDTGELAYLWIKVPDISSGVDTEIYIYYDNSKADNTTYIGEQNSSAAENVWDSYFKGVWHLRDGAADSVYDSTDNDCDGTKEGGDPIEVDGKCGKAQEFIDSPAEWINHGDATPLQITDYLTIQAWMERDKTGTWMGPLAKWHQTDNKRCYEMAWTSADKIHLGISGDGTSAGSNYLNSDSTYSTLNYTLLHGVYEKDTPNQRIYLDGAEIAGTNSGTIPSQIANKTSDFLIGAARGGVENKMDGEIDEVRISQYERSDAWIKADYETQRDNLCTFGSEELYPKTKEFTTDGILVDRLTKTFDINALLQKTLTKEFSMDGFLEKELTKTFDVDALLIKTYTKSFDVNGILINRLTKVFDVDSIIKSSFFIRSITTDIPKVIRTGSNTIELRVDFHDEADLAQSAYTVRFWVREPDNLTTHGPYTGTVTKESSKEYNATYDLDPQDGWVLGDYDIKVEIDK